MPEPSTKEFQPNRASTDPANAAKNSGARHAVLAGFLGWTLDAFDFFVVVFLFDTLAHQFGVPKKSIVFTVTATLAMRPLGALIFGLLSDRYGRRIPLMINVIYFSVIELLCGFAPNYTFFLIMRALFGIGMGGEWGVGASMVMEAARCAGAAFSVASCNPDIPLAIYWPCCRSIFVARFRLRAMFWAGAAPALLALYIRTKVPESAAWKQHARPAPAKSFASWPANGSVSPISLF